MRGVRAPLLAFSSWLACSAGPPVGTSNLGPIDAGPPDGGTFAGVSQCGQPLTACPSGSACPPHSTCGGTEGGCACEVGYITADCAGNACPRTGCDAGDLACVAAQPGACGLANYTVVCDSGVLCPTNAACAGANLCLCAVGYAAVTCAGAACVDVDGGCQFPGWWCAQRGDVACGLLNDSVQCHAADGGLYYCPSNSSCDGASCKCSAGYTAYACGGKICSAPDAGCVGNDWWCKQ